MHKVPYCLRGRGLGFFISGLKGTGTTLLGPPLRNESHLAILTVSKLLKSLLMTVKGEKT